MTLHATILEIITVAAAAWGVWYTRKNYLYAQRTVISVDVMRLNGSRRRLAKSNVRLRYTLLRVEQLILFIGIASLFMPPPPFPVLVDALLDRQARAGSLLVRGGFMIIAIVLGRLSRIDHVEEDALLAIRRGELSKQQAATPEKHP